MKQRNIRLPDGWYPQSKEELNLLFLDFEGQSESMLQNKSRDFKINFQCALLPHAGWAFTGPLIFEGLTALKQNIDNPDYTIICGGHMSEESKTIICDYDQYKTPVGIINGAKKISEELLKVFSCEEESLFIGDNTIEIFLPFIAYFFPKTSIIAYYPPANEDAPLISDFIFNKLEKEHKTYIAIGSADLTHYGPNYGFSPAGVGKKGYEWAKKNDEKLINDAINLDENSIVSNYHSLKYTCSPGSVISIINYAKLLKKEKGTLLKYSNSYNIYPSASFVGYASIVY